MPRVKMEAIGNEYAYLLMASYIAGTKLEFYILALDEEEVLAILWSSHHLRI